MAVPDADHYWIVAERIRTGYVTPFLGAGANLCDRPEDACFELGRYLPNGRELAELLAQKSRYPDAGDINLLRVSQYVDAVLGEKVLYEYLRSCFAAEYPPNALHRLFASLPPLFRELKRPYQLIITTNYDYALERAFEDRNEEYDLVWYEAKKGTQRGKFWHKAPGGEPVPIDDANNYADLSLADRTAILKLHGAVDPKDPKRDSFVITEDNYIDYLTHGDIADQIPVTLQERMEESHFLFLGYSMRDWNLRVILNRIWGARQLDLESWAIQLRPSDAQLKIEEKLWKNRGEVTPLYAPLNEYVTALAAELKTGEPAAAIA